VTDVTELSKETGRVEAFSDGVFAIAITLLVLGLAVPHDAPNGSRLLHALLLEWPSYLAFVTSFATIGIMWINHHRLFTLITRVDHSLLLFNGLLLLGVTFVPFPTAVLAEYAQRPGGQVAAMVYSGTFAVIAVLWNALWRYASYKNRLLHPAAHPAAVRAITRAYIFGPLLYLLSVVMAVVAVPLSLAMNAALAVYFALPSRPR
jgi:TMEM175 potassium channel family protein